MHRDLALIHGWGDGCRIWTALIPYIEDKWRVHCVDMPGYGAAVRDADLDQMARAIDCDILGNAHILAWSLGVGGGAASLSENGYWGAGVNRRRHSSFIERPDWPHSIEAAAFD